MQIAILLYDKLTALDAIGPYEVLSRLPGADLAFVATEPGEVHTDNGMLTLVAECADSSLIPEELLRADLEHLPLTRDYLSTWKFYGQHPMHP